MVVRLAMSLLAVTGVTGFIGGYVVPRLGVPYRALVRKPEEVRPQSGDILGDLLNSFDTRQLVQGADHLLHLACSTNPRSANRDIPADLQQNLLPSVTLFEQFYQQNPQGHIVFASTGGAMFDHSVNRGKLAETEIPKPWSSYGIHKLALEEYLSMLAAKYGGRATVLRISNPYGVFLPSARGQGLIGVALTLHRNSQPLSVIEPLETVRDYIHVEDVLEAMQLAFATPPEAGKVRLLHIGSGTGLSIAQVIAAIGRATGRELPYTLTDAARQLPVTYNTLDPAKALVELKWQPQKGFEQGLQALWQSVVAGA